MNHRHRHCDEHSDEAIHLYFARQKDGLLPPAFRQGRNDGRMGDHSTKTSASLS
jgi:hypothetical protein